jgi:hypothetical protein
MNNEQVLRLLRIISRLSYKAGDDWSRREIQRLQEELSVTPASQDKE